MKPEQFNQETFDYLVKRAKEATMFQTNQGKFMETLGMFANLIGFVGCQKAIIDCQNHHINFNGSLGIQNLIEGSEGALSVDQKRVLDIMHETLVGLHEICGFAPPGKS